jgi:hypothetical protein
MRPPLSLLEKCAEDVCGTDHRIKKPSRLSIEVKLWIRASRHDRILVREHLCKGSGPVRVDRVFALLIESGFIYCCIWILYVISAFQGLSDIGFVVIDSVLLCQFISGLYPTLIVVLVAVQRSPVEHCSNHSTRVQLPTFGPRRDSNGLRPVFTIHREFASYSDMRIPSSVFMETSDEEKTL